MHLVHAMQLSADFYLCLPADTDTKAGELLYGIRGWYGRPDWLVHRKPHSHFICGGMHDVVKGSEPVTPERKGHIRR